MAALTLFETKALGPLLQSDVFVAVSIAMLEEAGGAVLHGNQRSTKGGELRVGQVPNTHTYTHTGVHTYTHTHTHAHTHT